jgi:uncharacterized protein (DUF1778 family)
MSTIAKRTAPPRRTAKAATVGTINIRVRGGDRTLIDQAAQLAGKTRSEFMLEAARDAAQDTILDQRVFRLDPKAFARFRAMLDAPPGPNERLRRLMSAPAPWE